MGGEKLFPVHVEPGQLGSPPRGRGKDPDAAIGVDSVGITPAWAGKRSFLGLSKGGEKDHPRVGGEKSLLATSAGKGTGSPPRGRGKGGLVWCWPPPPRITPAWAGKSCGHQCRQYMGQDHPRVGGEKAVPMITSSYLWGSPPRGRGKVPTPFG